MDKLVDDFITAIVDFRDITNPCDFSLVDHRDPVGNPPSAVHVVADSQRSRAKLLHGFDDQFIDDIAHDRINAGCRFVEKQDLGFGCDRPCQSDTFLRTCGNICRKPVCAVFVQSNLSEPLYRCDAGIGTASQATVVSAGPVMKTGAVVSITVMTCVWLMPFPAQSATFQTRVMV